MPKKKSHLVDLPVRVNDEGKLVKTSMTPEDELIASLEAEEALKARQAAKRVAKAKPAPMPTPEKLAEYTSDGDLLDIWQRRMINPTLRETKPIRIKLPGMHLRWINLQNNGRYTRARYEEGWTPVRKVELVDEREIYGASYTTEGFVCRGEKQQEMLMRLPEAVWKQIRMRKYAEIEQSNRKIKDNMKQSGANYIDNKYGSGGDQVATALKGDIKFGAPAAGDGPDLPEYQDSANVLDPAHLEE